MGLGDARQAPPAVETETITYTRQKAADAPKKLPSRNPIPAHLRREEVTIEPAEDVTGLKKIGAEITEELEYQPGELYVKRYVRPKYARPESDGIVVGALPWAVSLSIICRCIASASNFAGKASRYRSRPCAVGSRAVAGCSRRCMKPIATNFSTPPI
jgi:hypothetical protein